MGPGDLARALCGLAVTSHPNLLVGMEQGDDAGVYRLTPEIALVQTVDFFTPIVDDPYLFGQIAAANALSDVYAMGGKPLCAMNIACFPGKTMDISVLQQILKGGLEKIRESDALLVGGHTIEDAEIKYGLSVTGVVHPERVLTRKGAQPGDRLILTKPLGTGIGSTAIKGKLASSEVQHELMLSMAALNRTAAELLAGYSVHACTDVTGFGLAGHAGEMVRGTEVGFLIHTVELPWFHEIKKFSQMGLIPGGLQRNRDFCSSFIQVSPAIPQYLQDLIFDPQTSGGLLIALPQAEASILAGKMREKGILSAAIIGEVVSEPAGKILFD